MDKLSMLANAIHPSIQVTYDCPNLNADGRMPVLDLKVWPVDIVHDNVHFTIIQHTYYAKPMSSKHVLHRDGALNMKTKMCILTNDLVRIMRNVSLSLPEHERTTAVQSFIDRMQYSGYSRYERYEVYSRAKKRFDKMIEDDKNGVVPLFRPKLWKQEERALEKSTKKYTWFKDHKSNPEAFLFVEATPNSVLLKNIERIINDTELKLKVVERSGTRLKDLLCKSNPFDRDVCLDSTVCNLCKIKTGLCKKREPVYCIECRDCEEEYKYIGETSRSLGERFEEHLACMNDKQSVFFNHKTECHSGLNFNYTVSVLNTHIGDPMRRQVSEAVCINEFAPKLNRKEEWTTGRLLKNRTTQP